MARLSLRSAVAPRRIHHHEPQKAARRCPRQPGGAGLTAGWAHAIEPSCGRHGIAKIVLVALRLKDKLWAYPWLIGLLLAFIAYQLYRITAVHFLDRPDPADRLGRLPGLAHLA